MQHHHHHHSELFQHFKKHQCVPNHSKLAHRQAHDITLQHQKWIHGQKGLVSGTEERTRHHHHQQSYHKAKGKGNSDDSNGAIEIEAQMVICFDTGQLRRLGRLGGWRGSDFWCW